MSSHGPPGGPYGSGAFPGQPGPGGSRDPYDQRDPYEPPSDPWMRKDDPWWDDELTAPQPPGLVGGYPPPGAPSGPGGYDPPPPPGPATGTPPPGLPAAPGPPAPAGPLEVDESPRRSNTLLFVAVALLAVVVAAGVAYALFLLSGEVGGSAPASAETARPESTEPAPAGSPDPTQDTVGLNAAMAQVDDCLVNHGTEVEPELQVVACDPVEAGPVYQLLARFDVAVDGEDRAGQDVAAQEICQDTDGYTHHYFELGESVSFVLCLAERDDLADEDEDEAAGE